MGVRFSAELGTAALAAESFTSIHSNCLWLREAAKAAYPSRMNAQRPTLNVQRCLHHG
jgi:hypothetical protein